MPAACNRERIHLNILVDICMLLTFGNIVAVQTFQILLCAYNPRGGPFAAGLAPENWFPIPVALVTTLIYAYLQIVSGASLIIVGSFLPFYLFYLAALTIHELHLGRRGRYITTDTIRQSASLRVVFRALQVLHVRVMGLLGPFIFASHSGIMMIVMYCNCALIQYWSVLQPFTKVPLLMAGIFSGGFWNVVLELGGYMHSRGKRVIHSWNGVESRYTFKGKIMRRFTKSCTPLSIHFGKNFVIRRITLLKYHKGIARGILRALLTTKRGRGQ